jgi:hypothetical protein
MLVFIELSWTHLPHVAESFISSIWNVVKMSFNEFSSFEDVAVKPGKEFQ